MRGKALASGYTVLTISYTRGRQPVALGATCGYLFKDILCRTPDMPHTYVGEREQESDLIDFSKTQFNL